MLKEEPRLGAFLWGYASRIGADEPKSERPRPVIPVSVRFDRAEMQPIPAVLLAVCAWCKRVRDKQGAWRMAEASGEHPAGTRLTHGICPHCEASVYPQIASG